MYVFGDVHGAYRREVERADERRAGLVGEERERRRRVLVVAGGWLVIVASGGSDSRMSQLHSAGCGSMLPALSIDRTSRVCESGASPVSVSGDVHGA